MLVRSSSFDQDVFEKSEIDIGSVLWLNELLSLSPRVENTLVWESIQISSSYLIWYYHLLKAPEHINHYFLDPICDQIFSISWTKEFQFCSNNSINSVSLVLLRWPVRIAEFLSSSFSSSTANNQGAISLYISTSISFCHKLAIFIRFGVADYINSTPLTRSSSTLHLLWTTVAIV